MSRIECKAGKIIVVESQMLSGIGRIEISKVKAGFLSGSCI